jgi:uncharacterized membrane protein
VLRAVVPPLAAGYVVFVAMVLVARRRPVPRPRGQRDSPTAPWTHVVGTMLGGYIALLAIVLVFHVWLAEERDAFASAVWGGAFLLSVALAAGAISGIITRRTTRRS